MVPTLTPPRPPPIASCTESFNGTLLRGVYGPADGGVEAVRAPWYACVRAVVHRYLQEEEESRSVPPPRSSSSVTKKTPGIADPRNSGPKPFHRHRLTTTDKNNSSDSAIQEDMLFNSIFYRIVQRCIESCL